MPEEGRSKLPQRCWEHKGCKGQRRENCPAYWRGQTGNCWEVAGSFCADLLEAYGRENVKPNNCLKCGFYRLRNG